jgi:hypothetical protein
MPDLPVDFEKKVRESVSPDGTGYPYRISAKDLMQDFVFAALEASKETHSSGLKLEEETDYGQGGHQKRIIKIGGSLTNDGAGAWASIGFLLGGGELRVQLTFENGLLTTVTGTAVAGSGTEGDPYAGTVVVSG